MSWLLIAAVSFASGLLGALGMGAGAVLLLYLRIYGGMEQFAAQGVNLLFFLPIAAASVLLHAKNHLIRWRAAGFCVLAGLPAVWAGVWLGGMLGTRLLSKLFAGLLLVIGARELFQKQ